MRSSVLALLFVAPLPMIGQTVLFNEGFEAAPGFVLNTTDASSTSGIANAWVVNSVYAGGSGTADCSGFPLDFDIPATPGQPASVANANGNYLHTMSLVAQQNGILCCSFGAADGFCTSPDDIFARMSTDVSTVGQADVSLKFWWLCQGGNQNYGQVYYSINGGGSWTQVTTPISNYRNQANWVEQTIALPAFGNQATLRFGFRFHNGTSLFGAADPGFAIDEVRIVAAATVPNAITTHNVGATAYCQGATLSVPFTATGTYTAGNVFSAQLSDAAGSFAAPIVIGTLSSTVSGSITAQIPPAATPGSGYRIRVVSSAPATVGADNGADLLIGAAPTAGPDANVTLCKNSGVYALIDYLTGASSCGGWTAPSGQAHSGLLDTSTDLGGVYTYTTDCPGACPQDAATLTVSLLNPANAGLDVALSRCSTDAIPNLQAYVQGGDLTGIFFYNGQPTNGAMLNAAGTYPLIYVVYGNSPCANDTAHFTFTVNAAPNAGQSTTLNVCANSGPVDLLPLLGTTQAGGTWTNPSGQPFSGILIPSVGASGLYTYHVPGVAPCADAQAFIAVVVDPCAGVAEAAPQRLRWLGQQGSEHLLDLPVAVTGGLELLDALGQVAAWVPGPLPAGTVRIELGAAPAGLYSVRLRSRSDWPALRLLHTGR
jgi:hypothetical protein